MSSRSVVAAAAIAVVFADASACRRGAGTEARERAYRANNYGVAQLEQFNYTAAANAFRQALEVDHALAIAHINLSLALLYSQDEMGAVGEANEAARLLPAAPQPHYVLGLAARAQNRADDAIREFERVRQIDAGDVGTEINLGQIYLERQQYPQAIALLRAANDAQPFNVTAAYNLGLALTRNGQTAEGAAILQRAQELRTTGYAITFGSGYLEQGRYAEALSSTGAEPELVDPAVPAVHFTPVTIAGANRAATAPSPFGRRFAAADLSPGTAQQIAAGLGGGITLVDFNMDGRVDLVDASPFGLRLFRNDGQGAWTDVTTGSGLEKMPPDSVTIGCVAGDYDNDGQPDLFVLRYGTSSLYRNDGHGHFTDVTASANIPPYSFLPGAAAFVDIDHDGDLDLIIAGLADVAASRDRANAGRSLVFPADFAPAPLRLLRNNGNGTFTDATTAAHLQTVTRAVAIVPTDFDNRRDVDVLIVNRTGPPLLFQNQRDGTFRDVATDVGLAAAAGSRDEVTAVAAADLNKDDFPDFFFAGPAGGVFALSDGRGRFRASVAPAGMKGAVAAQFVDYDNDGLLDLVTWSTDGTHVFRNVGQQWSDVTAAAIPGATARGQTLASAKDVVFADLNGDGRTDAATIHDGEVTFWRNDGPSANRSFGVALKGRVSNRAGIGSKIQVRAGSLIARAETSSATPAVSPADVLFGLGHRNGVDAVRVLWPSGILQAEAQGGATLASPLIIEELDRKPSSCPFLYTWNGERFEFVTDFMGGGEMGYLEDPDAPPARSRNTPDPVEYVRIEGNQLNPRNGRFEIRVTNELEETVFLDRLQLLAITHPTDVAIYPNEGMTETPKPFRLFAITGARVPRATDDQGRDVTERIAHLDRRYADGFSLSPFRGYAAPHTLTLDLASAGRTPVLLLTGWTDYAFSSDNLGAHQAGLALRPPQLQARDAFGHWRTIVDDLGIPVGRPQTVTVDLAGRLRSGEHEVRIVTNMRIYWDRVLVGQNSARELNMERLDPMAATLRARGFSAEIRPDGQEPSRFDYDRVSLVSPWKVMPGRYTRPGNVLPLLARSDDMFVVAQPGDEIAVSFDASAAGPLRAGWTRTFLLLSDGFSKEMDLHSASPDAVGPMPFHAMTVYPYRAPEHYPDSSEYQRYQATYNTRVVVRGIPRF